jgi:hypothetical protein
MVGQVLKNRKNLNDSPGYRAYLLGVVCVITKTLRTLPTFKTPTIFGRVLEAAPFLRANQASVCVS